MTVLHVSLFIDFWWFYVYFLQVDELISNTLLNVDMEEKVYTSVINWVKHEPSERKKYVARVRFFDTHSFIFPSTSIWCLLTAFDAFALSKGFYTHQWISVESFGVKGNKENTNSVTWINRIWKRYSLFWRAQKNCIYQKIGRIYTIYHLHKTIVVDIAKHKRNLLQIQMIPQMRYVHFPSISCISFPTPHRILSLHMYLICICKDSKWKVDR